MAAARSEGPLRQLRRRAGRLGSADWVEGYVVFNIGGNKYRLIVSPNFGPRFRTFFIKHVFTHRQYNGWTP